MNPATADQASRPISDLQPRQVHTITDRFAMANTYLIASEQLIVVDPYSELNVALLHRYLDGVLHRSFADVDLVVLTNLHVDQTRGLAALCVAPGMHVAAASALQNLQHPRASSLHAFPQVLRTSGFLPATFERQLRFVDTWLEDMTSLPVDGQWRVIASPGHSPDSLCLYNSASGELLCGETMLAVERHVPVLRGGSNREQLEHLLHYLSSLSVHYLYPGHGRPILAESPLAHISIEW